MKKTYDKSTLKQQFQLLAVTIKNILLKKQSTKQKISKYQKNIILSSLKKNIFISQFLDFQSDNFIGLAQHLQLQQHLAKQVVFQKGQEGCYYVSIDSNQEIQKQNTIFYKCGDSFGQVSLIYGVSRGATIRAEKKSSVIKINKNYLIEGNSLQKSIAYLNQYFQQHPYFENEDKFIIRVVTSLSKLVKFQMNEILVSEGEQMRHILFFIKGQAHVYKTLKLISNGNYFEETIRIAQLKDNDVFGEKIYLINSPSSVKVIGVYGKGQLIKVSFKDNIKTTDTPLYRRLRQNANNQASDEQILSQYKIYLSQKIKQLQFLEQVYNSKLKINKQNRNPEIAQIKKKLQKIKSAHLYLQ